MKSRSGTVKLLAVLLCSLPIGGRAVEDAKGSIPPKSVVVFDVWNYFEEANITNTPHRADIIYMLTSLQGIVNREEPRLYLLTALALFDLESKYISDPDRAKRSVTEMDAVWLEYLKEKGWIDPASIVQSDTLAEVVEHFRGEIKGLVKWDVSVGATINAAFMAAGAEDLLPVSNTLADGRLLAWFEKEFPNLKVKLDMSGVFSGGSKKISLDGITFSSCGSAKNDVYRFSIERFMKRRTLNPSWIWYNCDASVWTMEGGWPSAVYGRDLYERLGDQASFQHNGLYNADFWISKRGIFLDLYPWTDSAPSDDPGQRVGEDFKTWNDILEWSYEQRDGKFGVVGGFIPWWIKYTKAQGNPHDAVPGEHQFIRLITSYNMANDADAAFGIANASFFQHMPKIPQEECQWTYPASLALEPETTYIAFLMMDYDGSAWLNQAAISIYRDAERGRIPLNWCINPVLNERVPHAFRYMVENRTELDFFGIESDGAGYISPYYLQQGVRAGRIQTSGIKAYEDFAKTLRKRFGYQYAAFYITSSSEAPWLEMCARLNPAGFGVAEASPPPSVGETPVIKLKYYGPGNISDGTFAQALDEVYSRNLKGNREIHFEPWRCILVNPTQIATVVGEMEKKYPAAKVKIVDWPNLLQLKKQYLNLQGRGK